VANPKPEVSGKQRAACRTQAKPSRRAFRQQQNFKEDFTMKKFITLALAMVLAMSLLTACGGGNTTPSGGSSATNPPANSDTPGTSQGGNNDGNTAGWATTFEKSTGIPNLPIPSNCEVDTGKTSVSTVTFTAKAEVTEDEFRAYAEQVFDIVKSASPDGNYELSDESTKGDAFGSFGDAPSSSKLTYWYYTSNGFIEQISIDGKGSTLIVKVNDVYTRVGEFATP
jgi:predicted small secreted protein